MPRHFLEEIRELKNELTRMSELVEKMLKTSIDALIKRESNLLQGLYDTEDTVNGLQIEIDDRCIRMLGMYQPVAKDLRFITSAIKINSDLERIGDQAMNIAERDAFLISQPQLKPYIDLPRMCNISSAMLLDSIKAFINRDVALAKNVLKRDDLVDNLRDQIFRELLTYMLSDPKTIERAIAINFVSHYLERIADHATNIAEDEIYIESGHDIRHHGNFLSANSKK